MNSENSQSVVMLVDDDEIDLLQFERMLRRHGGFGEVMSFSHPEEALTWLNSEDRPHVELLFLDIKMPGISGFQFLKRAAADLGPRFVDAVFILTTLSLAEMHLERAITNDVVKGFFQKPLEPDDLRRVERILSIDRESRMLGSTQEQLGVR